MACTKYTEAQYQALNEAIALGALEVQYGDKTVKYRSLDEMIRLQMAMEGCLYPKTNGTSGRTYSSFSKGTQRR